MWSMYFRSQYCDMWRAAVLLLICNVMVVYGELRVGNSKVENGDV